MVITYSGIIFMIYSSFKSEGTGTSQSPIRVIWLIPSMICASLLAQVGGNVHFQTVTNTIVNLNTTETFQETVEISTTLQNPVWVSVHWLFFIIILLYVIINILILLTKLK